MKTKSLFFKTKKWEQSHLPWTSSNRTTWRPKTHPEEINLTGGSTKSANHHENLLSLTKETQHPTKPEQHTNTWNQSGEQNRRTINTLFVRTHRERGPSTTKTKELQKPSWQQALQDLTWTNPKSLEVFWGVGLGCWLDHVQLPWFRGKDYQKRLVCSMGARYVLSLVLMLGVCMFLIEKVSSVGVIKMIQLGVVSLFDPSVGSWDEFSCYVWLRLIISSEVG